MTLEEAIRRNPYDPERGNKSAYCRYLRYNVDGWYQLDSKAVLRRWQKTRIEVKVINAGNCMLCGREIKIVTKRKNTKLLNVLFCPRCEKRRMEKGKPQAESEDRG